MSKAIVVVDFAYKGTKRKGYGTGKKGLRELLKYVQYRDRRNNQLAKHRDYERWRDHGLGTHHADILKACEATQSPHVLAWTWVVSPAPDLMALVPEDRQRDLLADLTERVVEDYYLQRGFDLPEFSYVIHERETDGDGAKHLHTHVILPGTAPTVAERLPIYNNKERGHDALFREIASDHFSTLLDSAIGQDWRRLREEPELNASNSLAEWFPR